MKKYTTDDLRDSTGRIDRNSPQERRNVIKRFWIYMLLGLLMLALAVQMIFRQMMWEALFAAIFAVVFLYWGRFVYRCLKSPETIVFLLKGEQTYHYVPDCLAGTRDIQILTEKKALRKGYVPCMSCKDKLGENT